MVAHPITKEHPVLDIPDLPQHVAIIMDGNGRWAAERGLSRQAGHRAGTENIRRVIETLAAYHGVFRALREARGTGFQPVGEV